MTIIDREKLMEALGIAEECKDCTFNGIFGCKMDNQFVWACECITDAPTIDAVEVVRCGKCRHYQGNHDVPGCAPCGFWGIGEVMWNDYCSRGEVEG